MSAEKSVTSLFALILGLSLSSSARAAEPDHFDLKRRDHQLHTTVAYGATLSTHFLLKEVGVPAPQLFAATLVLAAGLIKEGRDPIFSEGDMAANAIGVTGATVFTITFDL